MRKLFWRLLIVSISLSIVLLLMHSFNISCPIRWLLFGVPCPCCGITRALLSAVKLDFNGYVKYNIMAIPLLVVFILTTLGEQICNKMVTKIIIFTILALNMVYYVFRLYNGLIP